MESITTKTEDITRKFPGASEKGLVILYYGFTDEYWIVERDDIHEWLLEIFINDGNEEEAKRKIREFIDVYGEKR